MALTIKILGSGTSVPSRRRLAPAYWVQHDEQSLLMDCGSGCSTSLLRAGGHLEDLDGVLLSHLHPDHTAELVPLLFALANPLGPERGRPLKLWGPQGFRQHHRALGELYGTWVEPREGSAQVEELGDQQTLQLGTLKITAFSVEHSGECLALRLEDGARTICYSGDSGPCTGLRRAAQEADVLLCECAAGASEITSGHMNAMQVAQLAAEARCKEVILTHLYDDAAESPLTATVSKCFHGNVRVAEDGMEI